MHSIFFIMHDGSVKKEAYKLGQGHREELQKQGGRAVCNMSGPSEDHDMPVWLFLLHIDVHIHVNNKHLILHCLQCNVKINLKDRLERTFMKIEILEEKNDLKMI